jgi:AraC family transcriptional activator of pobA
MCNLAVKGKVKHMEVHTIKTISDYHKERGLSKPRHPLLSLVDYSQVRHPDVEEINSTPEFYSIALKRNVPGKWRYGQSSYDFDEGVMSFFAPNQVLKIKNIQPSKEQLPPSGWMLFIHPDFLWKTNLAKTIKQYDFFFYETKEALFLSEDEEQLMLQIFDHIHKEYQANIDTYSKDIIITQIELLLNYAKRFYGRQFITREKPSHTVLEKLELELSSYFDQDNLINKGIPSVTDIAASLNVSPNYLSSLLKQLTGKSTQAHIHEKLIEKAKERLTLTSLSISEIAYEFGFEHPESFSKLFKAKTRQSPQEFRASFN